MADREQANESRSRLRVFAVGGVVCVVLVAALIGRTFVIPDQLDTAPGGAKSQTSADTTTSRGTPAQQSAYSTVGKNDPGSQEDATGGRARAIKETTQPLSLSNDQRASIKQALSSQPDNPRVDKADFEMMIGTAVPRQVTLQDIPPDVTKAMNGFWGDQFLLVQDQLVIVDQHSRRIVAIVPQVG